MAKVDVFVRSYCEFGPGERLKAEMRKGMRECVLARWRMFPESEVRLTVLHSQSFREFGSCFDADYVSLYSHTMHMESKRAAERLAKSDIYVVADDDCLPIRKAFVTRGVQTMERYPQFGILAAANITDGEPFASDEPVERHAVGGVAFVRRGILADFSECVPEQVDGTICDEFKRRGYKCGVMPFVEFNHLGAYYSISTKGCWAA